MSRTGEYSETARKVFGLLALITWANLALNFTLTIFNVYPSQNTNPNLLGFNPDGIAGLIGRSIDFFSYFTIVSNIVVALVLTWLWRRGSGWPSYWTRVFRLDSLMMITITCIVYIALLAPTANPRGLEVVTNALEHYIVPILVIITWLIWGPRGWFSVSAIFAALVVPILWAGYSLLRGAVIHAYPYPFLNVDALGFTAVLTTILEIAVFGVVLGFVFWGIEAVIVRVGSRTRERVDA